MQINFELVFNSQKHLTFLSRIVAQALIESYILIVFQIALLHYLFHLKHYEIQVASSF